MLHNMAAVNKPSTEACWSEIAAAAEALLLPTAIPTSAAAKATKSLMPSPTYITVLPKPCIQESSRLTLNSVDMHFSCLRLLDFTCPSRVHPVLAGRMPISARAAKSLMPSPQCKHDLPNPWTSTFLRPHSFELAAIISTWLLYNHGLKQARNNNQHADFKHARLESGLLAFAGQPDSDDSIFCSVRQSACQWDATIVHMSGIE